MGQFQKFFDFSALHFPKEQENAQSDMTFPHLKSIYCAQITLVQYHNHLEILEDIIKKNTAPKYCIQYMYSMAGSNSNLCSW